MSKWQFIALGCFVLSVVCAVTPDNFNEEGSAGEYLATSFIFLGWFLWLTLRKRQR